MAYQVFSQDEQDDIIVSFMRAQERDKFCHELNIERYTKILQAAPSGEWHNRVSKLKAETEQRLAETNSIIEATSGQMPPPERVAQAKLRLKS